ncbi:carbamoyl-phosphate synthase (glutamine-hydrolyzing) large subunit [Clostridiaceae bacterium M8S5]|nr:carbamoyl-phosphate synthase (glutamine-hydrolyzing) large subunit [Clostridiaceae bacterium M8S5]
MPLNTSLKTVLVIGSGPITIGQAAEFDYSGTQACKAIKEEGIRTILVNSNPATIMTDNNVADRVYIEPLNIKSLTEIIKKERPDGILAGFGGQTGLNLAMELEDNGILKKYEVSLLAINRDTIEKAEDRQAFKQLMLEIGEPIAKSIIATDINQCLDFVDTVGYPVIIRPAYTLGGTGGGIAYDKNDLIKLCTLGIKCSPISQILLEQSVAGWKEIEYEVIRDKKDNCIIICNMENMDPVGVHTGDSIVIAPSQTLRDKEYHMLRNASIKIIKNLKIEGGCNIQFALNPNNSEYIVIEVNPRVSRSSALASKAVGYPIAKISAKISIGYSLDELKNSITKISSACFEPALDYVVVKFPKWPFDKFSSASRALSTQMKATGEVMAISRTFESALLKAITCLDDKYEGLRSNDIDNLNNELLIEKIKKCDDERIFALAEALRRNMSIDELFEITKVDRWFLYGIKRIITFEKRLKDESFNLNILKEAKSIGMTDNEISKLSGVAIEEIKNLRKDNQMYPVYKMVDTCSGEFEAKTPYYYSCYEEDNENIISDKKKILVIGSGPIRIGQGIEFDYCCVHGVWATRELGYQSIIINNNPETVSTDFDTADKLYFESLYIENVMNIIKAESPYGVIVQFGGQTAINLANKLNQNGIKILGTKFQSIDLSEDRDKFGAFLKKHEIKAPKGNSVTNIEQAIIAVQELNYPVVVRPSYVIGGRAMQVVYAENELIRYMEEATQVTSEHPILIDKYIKGIEIEVDAISDGEYILIPGIMEHIERTGVHSGDSITVYPSISLNNNVIETLLNYTEKIAKELNIIGLVNIQYVYDGTNVYVIEVNPRASRTVPILSKITGIPMVKLAVDAMLGRSLLDQPFGTGLLENRKIYAVKVPVFSGEKLGDVDMQLGPEMKSTGEVLGIDYEYRKALYKGFVASGIKIPTKGSIFVSLKESDKDEGTDIISKYSEFGFDIYASYGTSIILANKGINCNQISFEQTLEYIDNGNIDIIINTPTLGNDYKRNGFKIRRKGIEQRIPTFTSIDTAKAFITAVEVEKNKEEVNYMTIDEYVNGRF